MLSTAPRTVMQHAARPLDVLEDAIHLAADGVERFRARLHVDVDDTAELRSDRPRWVCRLSGEDDRSQRGVVVCPLPRRGMFSNSSMFMCPIWCVEYCTVSM